MAATYRLSAPRRFVNTIVTPLARLGSGRASHVLTVRGRKTARSYSTSGSSKRGALARRPYGEVGWVRNARAAGEVELQRARRSETLRIEPVGPEQAAPVLREYLEQVPVVRPFFDVGRDAPPEAFAAEAPRHPVFRLTEAQSPA